MDQLAVLPDRGALAVTGEDRVTFLQGLVSNDVAQAAPGRAVWAALLTPQGKWLADFFVLSDGERLLLDCEAAQMAMLAQRLSRYRLRARVAVAPTDLAVAVAWGGAPDSAPAGLSAAQAAGCVAAPDPRLPDAGWRLLCPVPPAASATPGDWQRHRLALGLPDGSRDLESEKTVLLEAGFDELNGVSWTKGCYMGQELTARTRYRGLLKRRLVPVAIDTPLGAAAPAPGTPVLRAGAEVGTLRFADGAAGMAVLRLEALDEAALSCGDAVLHPRVPAWLRRREAAP